MSFLSLASQFEKHQAQLQENVILDELHVLISLKENSSTG